MAINISTNSTEPNNLNKDNYKANQIPATQGNVIETLSTYNDELKKKYYDKEQTRADENALQKSIMTLVKLLDANNNFTGKAKQPKTDVDETDETTYRLESYEGTNGELPACQDSSENKSFTESGLIQQINIISHLLSGKVDTNDIGWAADTHGNNVGVNEHTNCVPVIGYTRSNPTYTAEITKQSGDNHFNVNINGLNTNGNDDISDKTVLSEKQVSDMISQSVYNVLGQYDSRITGILAYLIYHAGNLPKSYEYVLGNYYTDEIEKAPLYITYEPSNTEKGNRWSVHDLNGENEFGVGTETEDFWYAKNSEKTENEDITFSNSEGVNKWQIKIPTPVENEGLTHVDVYYQDSSTSSAYSLPIPQKTFTLNLGLEKTNRIQYTCKFGGVEYSGNFNFSDGMGSVNVPQGTDITVTLPENFDGDLFYKYQYGDATQNKIKIETTNDLKTFTITMENDQEVYAKVLTYTLKNDGNTVSSIQKYYKINDQGQADVTFEVKSVLTKKGYEFTETTLGGILNDNKITISLSRIQTKDSYHGIESGEIIDTIDWQPKTIDNVTVHYVLDKSNISNAGVINTYPKQTITCTVGQAINFTRDIPDDPGDKKYHIGNECGYDFVGLYSSTELSNPPITECPEVDDLRDLYAVYEIKKYKYSLVLNDGTLNNYSTTGTKNWELEKDLDSLPNITRAGYKFIGWYTDINFANTTKVTNFQNQDATYYAKWEELSYTIEFKLTDNNTNIQPYFKYKSISVKASNFPVTLGEPVAEGYEFNGWTLNNEKKSTIEITDFNDINNKTITLTATWEPQTVTVLEEIYYEMDGDGTDGSNKKYDLVEVIKNNNAQVNSTYNKTTYTCADGFTEIDSDPKTLDNVFYKGDVVKRYFDRNNYTLTYHNEKATDASTLTTTQSFKYSDHNVLLIADPTTPADNYTFDCWVDKNGKKVTCIPAHTAGDVSYYAKYNQSAPVLGKDFEISRSRDVNNDTLTIKKIGDRTEKLCCLYKSTDGIKTEIIADINNSITLKYDEIYGNTSRKTEFALIHFGSESENPGTRIIVNESSKVEVPLKFSSNGVSENEYKQDTSAGTLEKTTESKGILEYRFQNDEDNDGEWYELNKPLHVEKEGSESKVVKLRRKETFDRICSEETTVTFDGRQAQDAPTIDGNIIVKREVSIYQPGQIEVKNGAFGNVDNGPLQYRIFENGDQQSGSAWLNVERPTNDEITSVYINVDKECTVYFRYGENAQYLASEPISVDVETVMHNVTFHLEEFPSKSGGYDSSFPNRNADGSFTIKVKSGSQLYKCDEYINKVKEWGIFGYTPYVEGGSPSSTKNVGGLQDSDRVLKFLYVKDGNQEVPFSELNVIDKNLELYMRFTPSHPASDKWTYTDEIEIEDYESVSSQTSIEISKPCTLESSDVSYGSPYMINVIKEFNKDLLSDNDLKLVLDWLDKDSNLEKTISFKELKIVHGDNHPITTSDPIQDCDNTLTFNYNGNDGFSVCDDDTFSYKFRSVFNFTESNDNLPTVQFKAEKGNADLNDNAVNGVIEQITIGNTPVPNFKNVVYSIDKTNQKIDFYWEDTPGTAEYLSIGQDGKISCDGLNDEITVFFHSGFYDGKLYPAMKKENVRIKRQENEIDLLNNNNIVFNEIDNNGFILNDGWGIKSKLEGEGNNE